MGLFKCSFNKEIIFLLKLSLTAWQNASRQISDGFRDSVLAHVLLRTHALLASHAALTQNTAKCLMGGGL